MTGPLTFTQNSLQHLSHDQMTGTLILTIITSLVKGCSCYQLIIISNEMYSLIVKFKASIEAKLKKQNTIQI